VRFLAKSLLRPALSEICVQSNAVRTLMIA
jgi:hypothetical protein